MDAYIAKYDTLVRKVVFKCPIGLGGIGDITKFILYLLELCINADVKLHIIIDDNPVYKFLGLRYDKMYVDASVCASNIHLNSIHDLPTLNPDIYYIATPFLFYPEFEDRNFYNTLKYRLNDLFCFSDEVRTNARAIVDPDVKYISIHLRRGDKHLETDMKYVHCTWDERAFDEEKLYAFIESNADKQIFFFCDNNSYKHTTKDKYDFIHITDYKIGHTSFSNTSSEEVLNSVTDFYLMAHSEHIYTASYSGFSKMAAKYNDIPITAI